MIKGSLFLTLSAALLLSACGSTFEGLKQDWTSISTATSNKITELTETKNSQNLSELALNGESLCPEIIIDPQLDSLHEFEDMQTPSEGDLVSQVSLTGVTSNCALSDDDQMLEMRLDLAFASVLGPKARRVSSDRPFFAYPYFIAVTDAKGQELAKEIFAASLTYGVDQNNIELVETINQRLPLNDDGTLPDYQIHIGFQLTDEQLFYNASL